MKLEPRIEKLEAAQPKGCDLITRIELIGFDSDCPIAACNFDGQRWTPFEATLLGKRLQR